MKLYEELPPGAQAAYSELYEAAQQAEVHRSIASLSGSFQIKQIKHKPYVYYAYRDAVNGKVRQIYIGPDSEALEALKKKAGEAPNQDLARLAGAAIAHGCAAVIPRHFRILKQLADTQFFRAGGILVGTHAYIAMGNLLGVRWQEAAHTQDIDFVHRGPKGNIALALPADVEIDVHSAIDSLVMGFLPHSKKLLEDPALKSLLQPLKFLEYLIEKPTQAALFSPQGAVIVNIPDPARYALHKLIVADERPLTERAKAVKDITQSATLISYCLDQTPHLLRDAWQDIQIRGPGWRTRVARQLKQLRLRHPQVAEALDRLQK